MRPKEYQERALQEVKTYLEELVVWRKKMLVEGEWLGDFAEKAWEKAVGGFYVKRKDGLGRPLPNFCLKVPTGGGKTYLAVKVVDEVFGIYRRQQTGLVVWIVPTTQIYRQTLKRLKDRDDPYRQYLDMASAGRTLILEKSDGFTPGDVEEHLCVLMLMLPSASRANKEALRMFRDSGAFQAFFPGEDDWKGHADLLKRVSNLEAFEEGGGVMGRQVKTSLGNTIRLLEPLIILDEGHKAYSAMAQETLRNLNPCMIVELSATPPKEANKLVTISGEELHKEEMIKLELRVWNRQSTSWHDTMRAAMDRRDRLEAQAEEYKSNTNTYIRPICLVQVERTGKEQRDGIKIHAEHVREYLIGQGIPKDWIAVKSAEIDEIKDYDDVGGLLDRDCPVRYIITKQALQEGWDCPFAYVLTILANPQSQTALTQLVGRILRQPYARKTGILDLDESYVYCFQRTHLLEEIKEGFRREGLEDLQGKVVIDGKDGAAADLREATMQRRFKKAAGNLVLPAFVIRDGKDWRLVSHEADILSRVDWTKADLGKLFDLELSLEEERDVEFRVGLEEDLHEFKKRRVRKGSGTDRIDYAHAAAHLISVVPNPWVGYEFAETVFSKLMDRCKETPEVVANNLVFVLEEMRKHLEEERDRLAEAVFNELLEKDQMRFMVVAKDLGVNRLPEKLVVDRSAKKATRLDGSQFEMNLFEPVTEDSMNALEHEVASFLDEQSQLYFWFRNAPHKGYYVQGWMRSKIYADFIFTTDGEKKADFRKVFVVETKGAHLKNENTDYKRSVFAVCNEHATRKTWNQFVPAMRDKQIRFEVVFQDEWKQRLNELLK